MKFAICNEMFVGCSVEDALARVAALGYEGVELAPFTLAEDPSTLTVARQKELARCAGDLGVDLFGQHWLLAAPPGLHVTAPDAAVRARTMDFFRKLIEIGVNTGARLLTLGSPGQRSYGEDDILESATDRAADFLGELAPDLEAAGATLALEPLEFEVTNFLVRTAEACDLVDRIGSPAFGVTLDLHFLRWEAGQSGAPLRRAFDIVGDRLAHLHIQDNNYAACGSGTVDYTEYAEIVKGLDWPGYLSFEAFGDFREGDGEDMAAANIEFLRELFPNGRGRG